MLSGKNLAGYATFSYDYFLNGGFISCTCKDCNSDVNLSIQVYHSGKLVETLEDRYGIHLLQELLESNIVNLKDETNGFHYNLNKYILWNMDARYEIISCAGCQNTFLAIFGMAELQPGREEVQFKGVWKLNV